MIVNIVHEIAGKRVIDKARWGLAPSWWMKPPLKKTFSGQLRGKPFPTALRLILKTMIFAERHNRMAQRRGRAMRLVQRA